MRVGLIDVDNYERLGSCFPNLALMKLSSWHKARGDQVEWYYPLTSGHMDIVYLSKVFSFSEDYPYFIDADKIVKGGTGYCITLVDGREQFDKEKNTDLPIEVEHSFPDYGLYGITDTAYGFMSRGCPRGCSFCHVAPKEGKCAHKVADLSEFWNGQKYIQLCDPNTLACPEWKDILQQLIDSKSYVDFNQGVDIRLMTDEKAEMIKKIKVKGIHFAFDRYEDKDIVMPRLKIFKEKTGWGRDKVSCYVLCGFKERRVLDEDIERVMFIRSLNFSPYVMLYDKESLSPGSDLRRLQRWVNNRYVFWSCDTFEEYDG